MRNYGNILMIFGMLTAAVVGCRTPHTNTSVSQSESLHDVLLNAPNRWQDWSVELESNGTNDDQDTPVVYIVRHATNEALRQDLGVTRWSKDTSAGMAGWVQMNSNQPPFLVFKSFTGGSHCCERAWIYQPTQTLKLVFDSAWFGPDGSIFLEDIDHDGAVEIRQSLTTFHYYDGMCHADSPGYNATFAWDKANSQFVSADNHFPELWRTDLAEIRKTKHQSPLIKSSGSASELGRSEESAAVQRAINLVFTGYEAEALAWLQRQFEPDEGKRVCETLKSYLSGDNYYRYIRQLPLRDRREVMLERAGDFSDGMLQW